MKHQHISLTKILFTKFVLFYSFNICEPKTPVSKYLCLYFLKSRESLTLFHDFKLLLEIQLTVYVQTLLNLSYKN